MREGNRLSRRRFLGLGLFAFSSAALPLGLKLGDRPLRAPTLRPPGALAEEEFLRRCIRCFRCGEVCPNAAIRFMGLEEGLKLYQTPYIRPREQGCMLCMKCTAVCPTGALERIEKSEEEILSRVRMGKARLYKGMCFSYNGRTCGVCYRACPFPGVAMKIKTFERPEVLEKCVGCGLCERACIHIPQAIRIEPRGKS